MTVYRQAPTVLATQLPGGEVVMVNADMTQYHGLTDNGVEIWKLFSSPRTVDEAVRSLLKRYAVDEATCFRDTQALVRELVERKLLVVASSSEEPRP